MTLPNNLVDREFQKFVETQLGETAVRTLIANTAADPVQVSGSISASAAAPTGPFEVTIATVTDVASNPLVVPLSNRVSLSIRNLSAVTTIYLEKNATVTPDSIPGGTGGWEINPLEDLNLDLDENNIFFLVAPAGQTATIKIFEIASSASGGGGGSLTAIQEVLTGVVNGVNTVFTTSQTPDSAGGFLLFLNGVYQSTPTHYSRVGTTVTFVTAPAISQVPEAAYDY